MAGLETAKWIYELQKTNPSGSDPISEGDDHIRMIKEVLKDSFPSDFDAPQIPDVSGNDSKILAVNETGTGTEWVDKYTPPEYPTLTWARIRGASKMVPIDVWTDLNISYTVPTDGTYMVLFGIEKWGYGVGELKENGVRLLKGSETRMQAYQFTAAASSSRAAWATLSSSDIVEAEEDDVFTLQGYQDNGPNISIEGGIPSYMNILRLA